MDIRQLGASGLRVSALGLGTMTWGRDTDEHEAAEQMRAFLDYGGTLIDTAAIFGDGDSERVVGGLLNTLAPREEVVIASKAGMTKTGVDNSRGALLKDLDESLKRLRTDYLDIWMVQRWDETVPLEETLSALELAVSSGRVRYIGISNFSGWQTARAFTLLERSIPLSVTENEYSLLNRSAENELLPCAIDVGLGVLAWSPLGRGVLTGKYLNGVPADSRGASPHLGPFVSPYLEPRARQIVQAVSMAADGLGSAPLEIALAWVRDAPGVTSAIVGARSAAQLRGILRVDEIELPAVVRSALDDVSAT
ncbi:MAG: aldo/keto reductase [Actinobacteria bacterium]|uniref:Aldo/keto reductase n=1 Tax=Candidatus Fonsibacter lacus TaxID=2576439 RepID=A0A965GBF3_9PROT|nr:aldo/keto reductase [Candidatus Fonsibacter lacus]